MNRKRSAISLSCDLTAPPTTLAAGHTPNTPEILNTIVSITTRMDQQWTHQEQTTNMHTLKLHSSSLYTPMTSLSSTAATTSQTNVNEQVHDFHSQFDKEGLMFKVKQNLKLDPDDALHHLISQNIKKEREDLSPEDEIRRQKRRESNKVAAEKCRNKKKKETVHLFAESEAVERTNANYKADIARLETEQRHLMNILAQHQTTCKRQRGDLPSQTSCSSHQSITFRLPAMPNNKTQNNFEVKHGLKKEPEDTDLLGYNYSGIKSNYHMRNAEERSENVFQPFSPLLSTRQQYEGQKYPGTGYSFAPTGYYDGVCAAI